MGLFGSKSELERMAGELLALRVTLHTTLEEVGPDFPAIGNELRKFAAAGVLELGTAGASTRTVAGFSEFMRSFVAAAKRHA